MRRQMAALDLPNLQGLTSFQSRTVVTIFDGTDILNYCRNIVNGCGAGRLIVLSVARIYDTGAINPAINFIAWTDQRNTNSPHFT